MATNDKFCQRRRLCICITVLTILITGVVIFVILETHAPIQSKPMSKNSEPTAFPVPTTSVHPSEYVHVKSVGLSSHIWQHRQGYEHNTHVQMLHRVQSKLNLSSCWLCTRLPQAAEHGFMTYAEPLPMNTSAYAIFWMLFARADLDVERNPMPFLFDYMVLAALGVPVWYSIGSVKHADLLSYNLDSLPYHDLITVSNMNTFDHLAPTDEECVNACPVPIPTHVIKHGTFCITRNGSTFVGVTKVCEERIRVNKFENEYAHAEGSIYFAGRSVYFLCGSNAYLWLPIDWDGTCNLVMLLPDILPVQTKHLYRLRLMKRNKRSVEWGDLAKGIFPWYGVISNSRAIRQLSTLFEETINSTATALEAITLEMRATRLVALQNRMGLDLLFVKEGGLCEKIGISCCSYIPETSSTVLKSIQQLHEIRANVSTFITSSSNWSIGSWFSQSWSQWGWKLLAGACGVLIPIVLICFGIKYLPALIIYCFKSKSSASTRMMVTKQSGISAYVPGYGLLPQVRKDAPELELRHLYSSTLSDKSNKSQSIQGSNLVSDSRVYTLKPSVYEVVPAIQKG